MTKDDVITYAMQKAKEHNNDPLMMEILFCYVWGQAQLAKTLEYMDRDIQASAPSTDKG